MACLALAATAASARADLTVGETTVLGPLTGHGAALHPDNLSPHPIEYYGTDLGWSYEHEGKLHFLFGDTFATDQFVSIGHAAAKMQDDAFGTVDLADWPDPALIGPQNLPRIRIGQEPDSSAVAALDPGHVMDGLKTPEAGFSNGAREFAIFILTKPQGCKVDADCSNRLSCDTGLGFTGPRFTEEPGLTQACLDGAPGCTADTMYEADGSAVPGSGFCVDPSSSLRTDTPAGRIGTTALKQRIGFRDPSDPRQYRPLRDWMTNKFINTTVRTVEDFVPSRGPGHVRQNYRPAQGAGGNRRVLLWGRPGFIGVNANGRTLGLYFAYVDIPSGPESSWHPRYFTGTDKNGVPRFSPRESDAVPVDLDAGRPGVQSGEIHDVVQHMSVVWIDRLK